MQNHFTDGIKNKKIPSSINYGLSDSHKKLTDSSGLSNQILFNGITPNQLVELLRPMINEEVLRVFSEQEEKLISPAETCKLFQPAITKATLTAWTEKGWLEDHRIGGRVYYLRSEILASTLVLGKYKSIYKG